MTNHNGEAMETTQQKAARRLKSKITLSRNDRARSHGVPKAIRQYAERYGTGLDDLIAAQLKYPHAKTLNEAARERSVGQL